MLWKLQLLNILNYIWGTSSVRNEWSKIIVFTHHAKGPDTYVVLRLIDLTVTVMIRSDEWHHCNSLNIFYIKSKWCSKMDTVLRNSAAADVRRSHAKNINRGAHDDKSSGLGKRRKTTLTWGEARGLAAALTSDRTGRRHGKNTPNLLSLLWRGAIIWRTW